MAKFKVGDRVRFKTHDPGMVLEITAIYESRNVVMLKGVEGGSWVGSSTLTAIIKVKSESRRKRARKGKPEDFWP